MASDSYSYSTSSLTNTDGTLPYSNDELGEDGDAAQKLAEALASLQLPHMPLAQNDNTENDNDDEDDSDSESNDPKKKHAEALPTFTILVCADIDLASTSALAEYLLMDLPHITSTVDLIIAAGPCARDEDLLMYCQGSAQRSKYKRRQQQQLLQQLLLRLLQ